MRINHNMLAMNTHRQMGVAGGNQAKSMEKLSSGLRINRAGDDAAGLSISEKMRAQIRGLDMASRNSQDGISMIQTAEGALGETQAILQRMRELAVQSANDTNVGVDRGEIQKEMNQLTSEINRIGNTTEFNTQKVLNGGGEVTEATVNQSVAGAQAGAIDAVKQITGSVAEVAGVYTIAVGAWNADSVGETITVAGETFSVVASGADASQGQVNVGANATDFASSLKDAILANDKLSDRFTATDATGTITLTEKSGKATAVTVATTVSGGNTSFTDAETTPSVKEERGSFEYKITDAFEAVGSEVTIGGVAFTAVKEGAKASSGQFNIGTDAAEQAVSLAAAINANATTGGRFDATVENGTIKLTEKIGEATGAPLVDAVLANNTAAAGKYSFDVTAVATDGKYTIDGVSIEVTDKADHAGLGNGTAMLKSDSLEQQTLNLKNAIESNADLKDKYTVTNSGDRIYLEQKAGEETIEGPKVSTNNFGKENFQATFQVGANSGQGMTIEIDDMRSVALGVSGNKGGEAAVAKNGVKANYVATTNVSNGTDNTAVEYSLDVSSHEKAQASVSVINDAIEKVSSQRSDLGSFQNRLEHTIKNLDNTSENLQGAEARIRDVDMAKEMIDLSKQNILQQAAQAMMAQANANPQGVLQLLR